MEFATDRPATDDEVDRLAWHLFTAGYDMAHEVTATAIRDQWTGNYRNSDTVRAKYRDQARRYLDAAAGRLPDTRPRKD